MLILILPSCTDNKNVETEKFQKHRDNIIDVSDKIVNIDPKIIIGRSFMKIIGDYLVVSEYQSIRILIVEFIFIIKIHWSI